MRSAVDVYTSYLLADVLFTLATRYKHYQMKPLDMVIMFSQLSIYVTRSRLNRSEVFNCTWLINRLALIRFYMGTE
jgi:hypothetical protein